MPSLIRHRVQRKAILLGIRFVGLDFGSLTLECIASFPLRNRFDCSFVRSYSISSITPTLRIRVSPAQVPWAILRLDPLVSLLALESRPNPLRLAWAGGAILVDSTHCFSRAG